MIYKSAKNILLNIFVSFAVNKISIMIYKRCKSRSIEHHPEDYTLLFSGKRPTIKDL